MSFWFDLIGANLRAAHRLEQLNDYERNDMTSTMTLDQARIEKAEAEAQILKIINDFQERAGVSLRGCELRHPDPIDPLEYREYGVTIPGKIAAVDLKIEI